MQEFITIENETKMIIKGAKKVVSSIPTQCVVETNDSSLVVLGAGLEITKLDLDNFEVVVCGKIVSMKFAQKGNKQPLLKRIFK